MKCPAHLTHLAQVEDGFKTPIEYSRLNRENAVVISIRKESGSNTISVAEEVHKEVEVLHTERPDLDVTVVRDNSEFVKHSFDDAIKELILGAVTASLVVLIFFRDVHNTLVTVAGLPVIMIGTFAVMHAMGLTLNIISLLALALCVVPLRQIVTLKETTGPTQLTRINRVNAVTIGGNSFGRDRSDILAEMQLILDNAIYPEGVEYSFSGTQQQQEEAFTGLIQAMLLSVLFVYMVLASQFGSFTQPLIIMMALPLSIIGAFVALLIMGLPLDMTVMIGFIMLMGLVTKNSILLVDLTNRLRRARNTPIDEALLTAAPIRLRPILMTAISLILGMLPVAIGLGEGSDFRRPMSVAIIGGLITSTLLTLIIVPTVYSLVERLLEAINRFRQPADMATLSTPDPEPEPA